MRYKFIVLFGFLVLSNLVSGQAKKPFRIMFYNVENFFDPFNDSITLDDEYTPAGERHWTWKRFEDKKLKLFKVIAASGNGLPPEIIGFSEIENRFVLNQLFYETPLLKYNYKIVHFDSPDQRGIDVALAYNPHHFTMLKSIKIPVGSSNFKRPTRDILYVVGRLPNGDTLHLFVNHWPSKYSGAASSQPFRILAASVLRTKIDSILKVIPLANIVVMGDFNDTPDSKPISRELGAVKPNTLPNPQNIYNLSNSASNSCKGTNKFQGQWTIIDQFLVSGNLLGDYCSTCTSKGSYSIQNFDFLLEPDEKYTGLKPFRTFVGFKYHGGFSDHLPITLDLFLQ